MLFGAEAMGEALLEMFSDLKLPVGVPSFGKAVEQTVGDGRAR
jgi:hypothetical protein